MRGKCLIFILAVLLLITSVSAYSTVNVNPVVDHIEFGEKATYDVVITNEETYQQDYTIVAPLSGIDWNINTAPVSDSLVAIAGGMNKTIRVEVIPLDRFQPGIYLVGLKIITDRGGTKEVKLQIYINPSEPREYAPAVKIRVDMNENIDPRETQSVKLTLENENSLDLPSLTVRMSSDMSGFNKEQEVDLKPFESKTVEFTIEPNQYQQPKRYYIFLVVERNNQTVKAFEKQVDVVPLETNFVPKVDETKNFLLRRQKYEFTNEGNVINTQAVKIEMNLLKDLISSTDVEMYVLNENGNRYLAKDVKLGPKESFTVNLKTSYRIPLVILILAVAFALFYIFYRNPVRVTKSASNVILQEGGVAGLKVTLVVKNTSNKAVKDVVVHDNIPSIASVEKEVEMGTLKPSQILRNKYGGILAKWKISELDAKEERLINYNIKSKLGIVGTIILSRAKVTFKDSKNRERTSYSNTYGVGGEKE